MDIHVQIKTGRKKCEIIVLTVQFTYELPIRAMVQPFLGFIGEDLA